MLRQDLKEAKEVGTGTLQEGVTKGYATSAIRWGTSGESVHKNRGYRKLKLKELKEVKEKDRRKRR